MLKGMLTYELKLAEQMSTQELQLRATRGRKGITIEELEAIRRILVQREVPVPTQLIEEINKKQKVEDANKIALAMTIIGFIWMFVVGMWNSGERGSDLSTVLMFSSLGFMALGWLFPLIVKIRQASEQCRASNGKVVNQYQPIKEPDMVYTIRGAIIGAKVGVTLLLLGATSAAGGSGEFAASVLLCVLMFLWLMSWLPQKVASEFIGMAAFVAAFAFVWRYKTLTGYQLELLTFDGLLHSLLVAVMIQVFAVIASLVFFVSPGMIIGTIVGIIRSVILERSLNLSRGAIIVFTKGVIAPAIALPIMIYLFVHIGRWFQSSFPAIFKLWR